MTDTPVALIVFLALGTVAVVLALLLVRSRQELSRSQLRAEAAGTEHERASRVAADLGARLQAVEAELRHLVSARIPELAGSLSQPNVPVPVALGTATLSPDLDRSLDAVLTQVREEVVKERTRVDSAAQAAMRGATTTIQALLYQLQTLLQRMQEKHEDPLVAEDLLAADFLNEQALRRIQSTAVVCGAWPGLTRDNSHVADVVVGASSRLSGYERVQVTNLLRDPVGVIARAVEPVAVTLTELMANALHYSHPDLPVAVTLQQGNTGASVIIDDAGVGMTSEEFTRAKRLMSGEEAVLITELGDPPRNGFAAIGQLVRQYGFSVHAESSPYGGVRAVVHIPGEPLLTLLDEEEHPLSAMAPYGTPVLPGHPAMDERTPAPPAASGAAPSFTSAGAEAREELPRRRRRTRAQPKPGSAETGSGARVPGSAGDTWTDGTRESGTYAEPDLRKGPDAGTGSGSGTPPAPPSTPEESAERWAAFQQGTASGRAAAETDTAAAPQGSAGEREETGRTRGESEPGTASESDRTGTAGKTGSTSKTGSSKTGSTSETGGTDGGAGEADAGPRASEGNQPA